VWRTLAVGVRFDFAVTDRIMLGALTAALVAISLHAVIGHTQYLYRGRHAFGSFDEVRAVSATVLGTSALVLGLDLAAPHRLVPASAPVLGGLLALVLMLGGRYAYRLVRERTRSRSGDPAGPPESLPSRRPARR